MRLSRLELYPIVVARETGFANEHVIVRLDTDDGATGWGEMSDLSHLPTYRFDVDELARSLCWAWTHAT
jgi:galactarate dehydratase (D-threo-forming)